MKRGLTSVCVMVLLQLLLMQSLAAAEIRAWLDRDSMRMGETVALNVEVEANSSDTPDFSALERDFTTLGTQSSRQVSIVNGQTSAKTLWAINLVPRQPGTYTIAPIKVGALSSDSLHLTVLPMPTAAQGAAGDEVFIEVSAEPATPYVQQQVRYTVKLYYAVDLSGGTLDEPQSDALVVRKLGRDSQYAATVGARRYQVLERHYALTAERSGPLTLAPISFRGTAPDNADPSGFFRRGRTVSAYSEAIELDVRAKPASWGDAPWLPAQSLTLQDASELPTQSEVGEPLTRTVRLSAQGLAHEQLPELVMAAPAGTEIYPDQPELQTRDDGTWLHGERTRKFAVVPTRAGALTLPAMTIHWWNTEQDRAEVAELPARTIQIVAGITNVPSSTPSTGDTTVSPAAVNPHADGVPAGSSVAAKRWRALAMIAFALWLLTALGWWRSRRHGSATPHAVMPTRKVDTATQRAAFLRACALGDVAAAERELLAWAQRERDDVRNLGELQQRLSSSAQTEALATLQRVRYAGAAAEGLAVRLQQAFATGFAWAVERTSAGAASVLPELYPRAD